MPTPPLDYLIAGELREEYTLLPDGQVQQRVLGGSAVYGAVGARLWAENVGVVARIGENFPEEWIAQLTARGFDVAGIKTLPGSQDTRAFRAYLSWEECVFTDPASHFQRLNLPLPSELADYAPPAKDKEADLPNRFGPLAVRPTDIPENYFNARAAHLAPSDLAVHQTLPMTLRRQGIRYVTCEPAAAYMVPAMTDALRVMVNGLDAFLPSETHLRTYFSDAPDDLWQAAEALGALGAKIVVIKQGARGQFVYDSASRTRWHVPAYAVKIRNLTGVGDAYCGGFLAGLAQTHDPLQAALQGAISASFVSEGQTALYALDSMPALVQARREALCEAVRKI